MSEDTASPPLGNILDASLGYDCSVHGTVQHCPWAFMDCFHGGDSSAIRLPRGDRGDYLAPDMPYESFASTLSEIDPLT